MGVSCYDFTYEIWINDANEADHYFVAYVLFNYESSIWYDSSSSGFEY